MQSIPTVLSPAAPDDITNTMLANPVDELESLRMYPPLANFSNQSVGGTSGFIVPVRRPCCSCTVPRICGWSVSKKKL